MENNDSYDETLIRMSTKEAQRVKWARGAEVYGDNFIGHPLIQLDAEYVDALNYLDEAARWGLDVESQSIVIRNLREDNKAMYLRSASK